MFKNLSISIIFLVAMDCFAFLFLGNLPKAFLLIVDLLVLVSIVLYMVYSSKPKIRSIFRAEVILLLIGALVSPLIAYFYHEQKLSISYYMNRGLYLYLTYFLLIYFRYDAKSLKKIIIIFTFIHFFFFYLQFVAYPRILFNIRVEERRGSLSIFLPGLYFIAWSFFYFLNEYTLTKKVKNLLIASALFSIYMLLANRNIVAAIILVSLIFIFLSPNLTINNKLSLTLSFLVILVLFYFIFQEVISGVMADTKRYSSYESVRLNALKFFLGDFQPSPWSYIFGNGAANENQAYGQQVFYYKKAFKFYQTDIGLIGDYTKYGLPMLIAVGLIFAKTIFRKMSPENLHIKYFFMFVFFVSFTRDGPFTWSDSVILVCSSLYILINDKIFQNSDQKYYNLT